VSFPFQAGFKRSAVGGLWAVVLLAMSSLAQTPPPHPVTAPEAPLLAFDAESKRYDAAPGESAARFTFNLTNVWTKEVVLHRVLADCGCATVDLPPTPWHLAPGAGGQVHAQMNLLAKMGLVTKHLTFFFSAGTNSFSNIVEIVAKIPLPPAQAAALSEQERQAAMAKALLNPQAIFHGDCSACHSAKGQNAYGEDLYAADCGICHESSRRASAVPDLHALRQPTDFDYWKTFIASGKPHTMMPAFAQAQGGPLSDAQVASLASYLNHTISHSLSPVVSNTAAASTRPINR
jgi:mono/diheme cytochrome c family protein